MRAGRKGTPSGHAAGLTLVELMVAGALFILVMGSLGLVVDTSDRMYRTETVTSHLESRAGIVMEQLIKELRIAGIDTLVPDPIQATGTSSMQYVQATGTAGNQVVWTPLRKLEFEYEIGEVDDGLDNNGNGLVDEGRLVLTEDVNGANERRRVLTRWVAELLEGEIENGVDDNGNGLVDERGFTLERRGRALVVRLTLQSRTVEGRLLTHTSQTSTRLRNRLRDE